MRTDDSVDGAEVAPLSFAQQRLWFLDQLEPGSPRYSIPRTIEMSGELDATALQAALRTIVDRHAVLRTRFAVLNGQPMQVVLASLEMPLPVTDLSGLDDAARTREVARLASEEARRPFQLDQGPVMRARLLRLGDREHVLLLNTHHIAYDGWSSGVLFAELGSIYRSVVSGESVTLPPLLIQYTDYARWQRAKLQGDFLADQLRYWRGRLEGAPTALEWRGLRARVRGSDAPGARLGVTFPPAVADGLRALSLREHATLFMTLLAAFQTLLARYTGQYDIVVGTPIANRTRTELESLIGFFVNTLALRTDLSGDPTFRELLVRVRAVAVGAYAHQELPFERLVEELQPERVLGQTPLFQVMITMQNTPRSELRLPGLTLRYLPSSTETAKFDLSLQLSENAGGTLRGTFVYNTELFEDTVIARMAEHFEVLLRGIVADPDARISVLPLMAPQERDRLLIEWNAGPRRVPDGRCVHELFEAQVDRTPKAVAIVSGAETVTYDELNRRANRLANHLRGLGVRRGQVVGLCLDRSVGLIVGLLGIMKANAAYVPLDPLHPVERLRFVLDDSGVDVVVAEQGTAAELAVDPARVVCLDSDGGLPGGAGARPERQADPVPRAHDGDLAYVLYTSGSTGRPKGVMVEHRSVVNYLAWVNDHLFDDGVRSVPMITGLTFDASLKQALAPLLRGGAVWILPREVVAEPVALLRALDAAEGVGINCVPSVWATILGAHESSRSTTPVRGPLSLMLGGESIPDELLRRTRAAFPALRIWNLYGPTETTANAAAARLSGDRVVIGRPAAGARLYVLDRHLQPVPTGVAGELCVGGAGVARGYLGHPGLTADRFIPDPFGAVAGSRLYRTGDQVRWRSDGELEYLGRLDDQVKLRGHRIELGEIEAVLAGGANVRECAVLLREDAPDERRLVAYVVGEGGDPAVRAREWREHLKRRLPDYMVPAVFVALEALPLTPTGKVDRRALPAPERSSSTEEFVPPRTPTETQLAGIWMAVLRLDRVDARDDFFALGGHSLLATQVVSRVRETFGVELPLRAVFEAPGLADLAQRVEQAPRTAAAPAPPPPLVRAPRVPYSRPRP